MNLSIFNTGNLYDAATDFFEQLGIKLHNNVTANAVLVKDILGNFYKDQEPFTLINKLFYVGRIPDIFGDNLEKYSYEDALEKHYNSIIIFAVELQRKPTRSEIAELVRAFNRKREQKDVPPVLLLLKYNKMISLALPELAAYKQIWRAGEKVGKIIILRDISIEPTHVGHLRILQDLAHHKANNFNELHEAWLKVLDVNVLNKRFFQELSNWYFWAMGKVQFPDDKEKDKEMRNATNLIRLITRIVFIWFIKEKGLVPENLFDVNYIKTILKDFGDEHHYYNAILQNLFFGTLNQKMGEERKFAKDGGNIRTNVSEYGVKNVYRYANLFAVPEQEALDLFKDVPFLNGGLFDCLDKENEDRKVEYVDGFSRNPKKQAIIPDELFFGTEQDVDLNSIYDTKGKNYKTKGLIPLLNSYKFTIAENTPLEEDVALDPELLGKVFENLLASYNPETKTTARKQTGSFYTPREIVNYMVDESLIAYLTEANKELLPLVLEDDSVVVDSSHFKNCLREVLSYSENTNPFNEGETKGLIEAINNCKILDPACGSGAFPMGILHKMVAILQKIDPENHEWRKLQEEKAGKDANDAFKIVDQQEREERLKEISDVFENNASDYGRKLYLIENCIFGVDIQPIAVQISKLRFFISLIIDQKADPNKENFGIRSLPNLETKFVAANTLIGLEKENNLFRTPEIERMENELKQVRHEYFTANNRSKKLKLQEKDKKLRKELAEALADLGYSKTTAENIAKLDLFDQNKSENWFDPEWMFGLTNSGGYFDIVIGNPPYLRIQGIRETDNKLAEYLIKNYNSATGSFDLYAVFVERAIALTNKDGIANFIMPVKWTNASFGKGLREVILKEKSAYKMINFVAYQVFNASTYTGLQWFKRGCENLKYLELEKDLPSNQELDLYLRGLTDDSFTNISIKKLSSDSWTLTSGKTNAVLSLLETQPRKVQDVFDKNFVGLQTSKDDVYFLYQCIKDDNIIKGKSKYLDSFIEIEKGLVKPLLKGEDVHKYDTITTEKQVIFPYKLENNKAILYTEKELQYLFPLGYQYLKQCEAELRNREKGRLINDAYWYRYIYPKNLTLFDKEKLVSPYLSLGCNFSYDYNGEFYQTTKVYGFIKKENVFESYRFWLAVLNSKLLWYFVCNTSTVFRGGYYVFTPEYLNLFSLPEIKDLSITKPFEILVDYLTYLKAPNSSQVNPYVENKDLFPVFEGVLNMMVYELYFEEHMKGLEIDVLQFADFMPINSLNDNKEKAKIIGDTYNWLQKKENPIRNRIILSDIRSTEIIRVINSSI
jgi:hypothetical protein